MLPNENAANGLAFAVAAGGAVADVSAAFGVSFVVDLTNGDEIGVDEAGAFVMLLPKMDFCTAGVGAAEELATVGAVSDGAATVAIDVANGFVIVYECGTGC